MVSKLLSFLALSPISHFFKRLPQSLWIALHWSGLTYAKARVYFYMLVRHTVILHFKVKDTVDLVEGGLLNDPSRPTNGSTNDVYKFRRGGGVLIQ